MAIARCESWPARLALTQPVATALASSSDAPAALSSAVPMRVRRSAWTIGMGPPHCMPARKAGLVCCRRQHGLKAVAGEQGQNVRPGHATGAVLRVADFIRRNGTWSLYG